MPATRQAKGSQRINPAANNLSQRWAGPTLAAVTIGILAVTLVPLRPQPRPDLWAGGPTAHLLALAAGQSSPNDVLNNVLLFLPLGVALALLLHAVLPGLGVVRRAGLVALGAASLSLGVEVAQLYLPERVAALADVAANTGGALLGAACLGLALVWGASRRALVSGMLIYLAAALATAAQIQTATRLDSWDPGYRLLLGNEGNGRRPWSGTVHELRAAAVHVSPDEARALAAGGPAAAFEQHRIFDYTLAGTLEDQAGVAPALSWREGPVGTQPVVGAATGPGSYLRSTAPMREAVAAVRAADAFTIVTTVEPLGTKQRGPARIISLSYNNSLRNLTLAQDGADLVVRLRTASNGPNGALQVLRAPGLLAEGGPQRLVLTYGGAQLTLYVAGRAAPYTLALIPEAVALAWLVPGDLGEAVAQLPAGAVVWGGWLLVHGLIGLPLGAALAWSAAGHGPRAWGGAVVAALALSASVELVLAFAGGRPVRLVNIGGEIAFALGALSLFGARAGRVLTPTRATMEVRCCPSSRPSGPSRPS